MLYLDRHEDEQILIGDDIVISIVRITHDGKVRLGVTAPRDVPIHREEVRDRILAEGNAGPTPGYDSLARRLRTRDRREN